MLCSFAHHACSPLLQRNLFEEELYEVALTCRSTLDVMFPRLWSKGMMMGQRMRWIIDERPSGGVGLVGLVEWTTSVGLWTGCQQLQCWVELGDAAVLFVGIGTS